MECSIGISGTGRISTFEERVGGVAIFSEENYNNTIWQLGISKGSSLTKGAKAELILKEHGNNLAAAAKLLQSCPALCDLIDGSPLGSSVPGILQARTLEWVTISFSNAWKWKVKVRSLSRVLLLSTPWTAFYQAPPLGLVLEWVAIAFSFNSFYEATNILIQKNEN